MGMSETPRFILNPFTFPDMTIPKGLLPSDMRAQACWYFYVLAESARQKVGNSTDDQFGVLEGELWMDKRYEDQARAVAMLYGLESPSEFAKFWPYVRQQALKMGYPINDEYIRIRPGSQRIT